jgi:hypothetical protein
LSGRARWSALWTGVLLSVAGVAPAQQVLYGGNEWLQFESPNTGWLVTVDQQTAAVTLIGRPAGVARLSGLAFDAAGTLWAATLTGSPSGTVRTSTLIQIDPRDGSLLETIGPILDGAGGPPIAIESLSFQPGTGILFGSRGIADLGGHTGELYRIDAASGIASLVGDTGFRLAMIAFAPDGTLYQSASNSLNVSPSNAELQTLDPATGAVLTSVPTARWFKALAFRDDGVLFGASPQDNQTTDVCDVYVIEPATGVLHFLGDSGNNPIGSLAFGRDPFGCLAGDPRCLAPRTEVLRPDAERPAPREVVRPDR